MRTREEVSSSTPKHSTGAAQTTCKRLSQSMILRSRLSNKPISYLVEIEGTDYHDTKYRTANVYEEYHPLMAIGRAVIEFQKAIIVGSIEHIIVSERVMSNR